MVSKEEKNRIDAQWQLLQPGWDPKDNQGERKMLYDALEEGENIERLSAGGWKFLDGRDEMESHQRGVVVATDRCVIFLNKGRLSKNVRRISYHHIETVEETGTNGVRITGPGFFASSGTYETQLPAGMTASFADFVRSRLVTDAASVKAMYAHFLDSEEGIEYWTRCSGGVETVSQDSRTLGSGGPGGTHSENWWAVDAPDARGILLATDRRVFFEPGHFPAEYVNVPYTDLLTVMHRDRSVKFAGRGRDEVYVLRLPQAADAQLLAGLMQNQLAAGGRPDLTRPRVLAEWRIRQPIWSHRNKRDKERYRLPEIMDDGERLEALLGGVMHPEEEVGASHDGVVAATDRRLIFVSESMVSGGHVGQLPYDGISEIVYEQGRIHKEVIVVPKPGYPGYRVSSLDDERPNSTRQSGWAREFAALVQGFLPNSATSAMPSRRSRINAQWQEHSPDWKLDTRKNEREKLMDVLFQDEDIERLIEGNYKADVKGAQSHNVVVAATHRRIVFVYNGWTGEHVNEMPYPDIERVEANEGRLLSQRITIVGRAGANNYVVEVMSASGEDFGEGMQRFADCVRSHLANSP